MMKTDTKKTFLEQELEILSIEDSAFDLPIPQIADDEDELDLEQLVGDSEILLAIITEQVRSRRLWQIAAASLIIFAVTISFVCLGLYIDRGNYTEISSLTQANIQKADNDLARISQKATTLETQLAGSNSELKTIKNELTSSKAQFKRTQGDLENSRSKAETLQSQLTDTSRRLKSLQDRNAQAVKRLNERLIKLSD